MELALYHPDFGYYNAEAMSIGKQGDFTMAPKISPLFAKCFARQCQQILSHPGMENILELGAGTGRFASDLLSSLLQSGCAPRQYFIYEISSALRKMQQDFLQETCPSLFDRIIWISQLPGHFKGIIIANEVLACAACTYFSYR